MVWPNLLELVAITDRPAAIARGAAVPIRYWYDDTDSTATITLRLDRDTNPFNNISLGTIAQVTVSATGSGFAPRDTVTWNTAATGPGTYFVYGEIADAAGRRRFLYDERALTIVASAAPGVPPPRVDLASRAGGVTLRDGRLMVGAVSDAGRAIIHWRSASGAWSAVDLWDGSPQTTVARAVRVWADAATGGAYAAVTTISGVFLYSEDLPGIWSMRPLSAELGGAAIVRGLEAFISRDGRAHLVGSGESGATFLYEQVGASADGVWTFLNLSTQVGALGLTAPVFVGDIVTLVTPWNALNIAGLDAQGQIRAFWKATGTDWSVANLSNQTGASALAGGLTAFTTSWNAMNFLGTDEGGAVLGVWWTPSTGWRRANLTASISGGAPGLDPASVTSFVTPWNAMNVVGRNAAGKVVVYWWTPSSGRWQIAPLSDLMPDAPVPVGPLAAESSRGGMSVLGPSLGGQLMRYAWGPDAGWLGQNLSSASRLA